MRTRLFLTASVFLAGASVLPAQAQYYDNGYNDSVIRCESRDNRTERCAVGGGGDIRLVRQLSGSPCVRGRNWGTDSRGIWVSGGCRAEFSVGGYGYGDYDDDDDRYGGGYGNNGGDTFRCESTNNRTERCASAGRAEFIRQLSNMPCVRGQSWGTDSRGVWVSNGCRGLFRNGGYGNGYGNNNGGYNNNNGGYGGSDLIRCESADNRSRSCSFTGNSRGEIRLLRQLSGKPCVENQTWGRSRNGVWVTQGCRAEFVIGRGNRGGNSRPPGANVRPPGDLGGGISGSQQSGTQQPGVFQNTAGREDSQRSPAQTVIERPRGYQDNSDASPRGQQIRSVEETQPAVPARPVERPVAHVEQRNTGGAAQPGVVEQAPVSRSEPAPREREGVIQRGERPH
ncbi:MAG: DUF3011 domain-containing protein [Pseudomonadota bacterium]